MSWPMIARNIDWHLWHLDWGVGSFGQDSGMEELGVGPTGVFFINRNS